MAAHIFLDFYHNRPAQPPQLLYKQWQQNLLVVSQQRTRLHNINWRLSSTIASSMSLRKRYCMTSITDLLSSAYLPHRYEVKSDHYVRSTLRHQKIKKSFPSVRPEHNMTRITVPAPIHHRAAPCTVLGDTYRGHARGERPINLSCRH